MAAFTIPSEREVRSFLDAHGIDKFDEFHGIEGGSVNSNFSVLAGGKRFFLRLYEEQDEAGATAELGMLATLASRAVPTPVAVARGVVAGKPAALFRWVDGTMTCQRGVSEARAREVGAALARVHVAGADVALGAGRFHLRALGERLETIDPQLYPVARLRAALHALAGARDASVPQGLVHGDLFRDNVLWAGDRLAALLDFESAFRGPLVYDLAVTVLAWTYGDAFEAPLVRAMLSGYASVRPLAPAEKRALCTESRIAALRFTITRITDYAMRGGENRVMKDWRRFLARLDALETFDLGELA